MISHYIDKNAICFWDPAKDHRTYRLSYFLSPTSWPFWSSFHTPFSYYFHLRDKYILFVLQPCFLGGILKVGPKPAGSQEMLLELKVVSLFVGIVLASAQEVVGPHLASEGQSSAPNRFRVTADSSNPSS